MWWRWVVCVWILATRRDDRSRERTNDTIDLKKTEQGSQQLNENNFLTSGWWGIVFCVDIAFLSFRKSKIDTTRFLSRWRGDIPYDLNPTRLTSPPLSPEGGPVAFPPVCWVSPSASRVHRFSLEKTTDYGEEKQRHKLYMCVSSRRTAYQGKPCPTPAAKKSPSLWRKRGSISGKTWNCERNAGK